MNENDFYMPDSEPDSDISISTVHSIDKVQINQPENVNLYNKMSSVFKCNYCTSVPSSRDI